jgi:hypothetical protein
VNKKYKFSGSLVKDQTYETQAQKYKKTENIFNRIIAKNVQNIGNEMVILVQGMSKHQISITKEESLYILL